MAEYVRRKIAHHSSRMNPGAHKHWAVGGSVTIVLQGCGHEVRRKLSQGVPKSGVMRCIECTDLSRGVRVRTGTPDGGYIAWTWDPVSCLPVSRVVPPEPTPCP